MITSGVAMLRSIFSVLSAPRADLTPPTPIHSTRSFRVCPPATGWLRRMKLPYIQVPEPMAVAPAFHLPPPLGFMVASLSSEVSPASLRSLRVWICLLYTSDAADERSSVDLG